MVKKITAFVVLIALMVNLMGHFVIFQCNQLILQREMAEMIRAGTYAGKLEIFRFPQKSAFRQFNPAEENEFCYHGVLYDVIARDSRNDTTMVICLQDKNEQNLVNNFTLFLREHPNDQNTGKTTPLLALAQLLLIQALIQKTALQRPSAEQDFFYPVLICHCPRVFLTDFTPPPETVS